MDRNTCHIAESARAGIGDVATGLTGLAEALLQRGTHCRWFTSGPESVGGEMTSPLNWNPLPPLDRPQWSNTIVHLHGPFVHTDSIKSAFRPKGSRDYALVVSLNGWLGPDPTIRSSWRIRRRIRRLVKQLQNADAILCNNDIEAKAAGKLGLKARIEIAPGGIAFAEYQEANGADDRTDRHPPSESFTILVPAPIHPAEGLVPLLKAVASVERELRIDQVVLLGKEVGDWRKMIEAAVRRKGGIDRVRFITKDDRATHHAWLGQTSLVVVPSLKARNPVAILQALAAGVPVIATQTAVPSGAESLVTVCDADKESMARAIATARSSAGDTSNMTWAQRRERAAGVFDWSVRAAEWYRIYESLSG